MLRDYLSDSSCRSDPSIPAQEAGIIFLQMLDDEALAMHLRDAIIISAMRLSGDPSAVSDELKRAAIEDVLLLLKESFKSKNKKD